MILPDHEIRARCRPTGVIADINGRQHEFEQTPLVDPFIDENVQPASIDVRLSNYFMVFERNADTHVDLANPVDITKKVRVELEPRESFTLHPGEFVLGATIERVNVPDDLVARIEGKSSLGRLGLIVHATAGYIDPGFSGPITLEMTCLHPLPIIMHPGMLIGQISFSKLSSRCKTPYQGRYQNAQGVESSKYSGASG